MKIYHGSIEKVEKPEIRISKHRTLDYRYGFTQQHLILNLEIG